MEEVSLKRSTAWGVRAVSYLLYAYVAVTEVVLLIGFVLKLFGANPSSSFTQWAYRSLDRVMAPFRGIFTSIELGRLDNDVPAVLDMSIVFAMVVYGVLLLALRLLIDWLSVRIARIDHRRVAGAALARLRVGDVSEATQRDIASVGAVVATTDPSN